MIHDSDACPQCSRYLQLLQDKEETLGLFRENRAYLQQVVQNQNAQLQGLLDAETHANSGEVLEEETATPQKAADSSK